MSVDYLNPDAIKKQLIKVNSSPDSIGATGQYLNFHARYTDKVMAIWKECILTSQSDHQLLLMYVLNDLVQVSRRKSDCFIKWCLLHLTVIWEEIKHGLNLTLQLKMQRIFDVWIQRHMFPREFIDKIKTTSNQNPFIYIVRDVQKTLKSLPENEKKNYLKRIIEHSDECNTELKNLQYQIGSPTQVSHMLNAMDPSVLSRLIKKQ